MSLFLDNISLLLMYFIHMLSRLSYVRLSVTLWTVACQAPLSMGFSRQGYWSGLPFPSLGDLPDPGIELSSPAFQVDSLANEISRKPKYNIRSCFSSKVKLFSGREMIVSIHQTS